MNIDEIEPVLARYGWSIECESPLELRHNDGSFASGAAAKIVIDQIVSDSIDAYEHLQFTISNVIADFEEDQGKTIGCFRFLHNPDVEGTQLLELANDDYKFIPSEAQIIAPHPIAHISRLDLHSSKSDD